MREVEIGVHPSKLPFLAERGRRLDVPLAIASRTIRRCNAEFFGHARDRPRAELVLSAVSSNCSIASRLMEDLLSGSHYALGLEAEFPLQLFERSGGSKCFHADDTA